MNLSANIGDAVEEASPDDRLRFECRSIDTVVPSPVNARTHTDNQVAEIAGSIRAFGFTNPLLVAEDGTLIAGHGRLAAARKLGLATVPVTEVRGLSPVKRRQLMLAENRIALNAGWDLEMLHLELKDLAALGADLTGVKSEDRCRRTIQFVLHAE